MTLKPSESIDRARTRQALLAVTRRGVRQPIGMLNTWSTWRLRGQCWAP